MADIDHNAEIEAQMDRASMFVDVWASVIPEDRFIKETPTSAYMKLYPEDVISLVASAMAAMKTSMEQ